MLGAGSLYFCLDSVDIKMSEMTWYKVVTQLWGVLCWFEASCVCMSTAFWAQMSASAQAALSCVCACPCFHVPQCVGLDKNLWFSLSVPLLTLPFGWLKELVLLRTCFCLCKITFLLEITSDCGLQCFLGIIIHYGSDFNAFRGCYFQVVELLLHVFLSS